MAEAQNQEQSCATCAKCGPANNGGGRVESLSKVVSGLRIPEPASIALFIKSGNPKMALAVALAWVLSVPITAIIISSVFK